MISKVFPKIHAEGYKFLVIFGIVTIVLYFVSSFLGLVGLMLTVWCYYFFRDPERYSINNEDYLVSPADGEVIKVEEVNGPKELGLENKKMTKIIQEANLLNISNVRGLQQFVADDTITKIKSECLKKAVLDARTKALSMAKALDRKLGKHFRISEGVKPSDSPRPMPYRKEMFAVKSISSRQGPTPVVAQGYRTFHFHVTGEFGVQ